MDRKLRGWFAPMALTAALVAGSARAGAELSLGFADDIDGEAAPIATLAWLSADAHPWETMLGHIGERDGTGLGRTSTVTFAAVGKRLTWRRWFVGSAVALTDTDRDNRVLSGPVQFVTTLGWSHGGWSIMVRHMSNADTTGVNRGETFLLVGYAF